MRTKKYPKKEKKQNNNIDGSNNNNNKTFCFIYLLDLNKRSFSIKKSGQNKVEILSTTDDDQSRNNGKDCTK